MPYRAPTEVCVSPCREMCVPGGMEQCVYREAAECCVHLSGIRMIPPSGRTKTMRYDALKQCLSAGAE